MPAVFFILSIFSWLEIVVCFVIYFPIQFLLFIFTSPFDKKRRIMHYNSSLLCTVVLAICPVLRTRIEGRENIDRSKSHVLVMNHQSFIDILLFFVLYYPAKMIAKKALGTVPIVGWNLFLSGHILIDRANRKSQLDALRRMDRILQEGDSLMIYPEGTRSKDGEISEFNNGSFRSAVTTGTSILPVVVDGAFDALPSTAMTVKGFHKLKVSILPPIEVEKGESKGELARKCQDLMSEELKRLRAER